MNDILTAITTVGFPIVACIGLAWFCMHILSQQQKNYDRMFEMYDKGNNENREAIKANTEALTKLCEKLDDFK